MESVERFDDTSRKGGPLLSNFSYLRGQKFLEHEHFSRYLFSAPYVKDGVVLDIACGSGYGSFYLSENGAKKVIGADKDVIEIENAKRRYKGENLEYVAMDAEEVGFQKGIFDAAVSFETIEHIEHPERFLSRLREVVKPGGVCIFSTPNREISNPGTTLLDRPKNPFHVREYSMDEFMLLLGEYFVVKEVYGQGRYKKNAFAWMGKLARFRTKLLRLASDSGVKWLTQVHSLSQGDEPTYVVVVCGNSLRIRS